MGCHFLLQLYLYVYLLLEIDFLINTPDHGVCVYLWMIIGWGYFSLQNNSLIFEYSCMCVCWRWKTHAHLCVLSCDRVFGTPWTVACQAPLSMKFFRQEYWSGLPFPSPRNLPDPGIELTSFTSTALAGGFFTTAPSGTLLIDPI